MRLRSWKSLRPIFLRRRRPIESFVGGNRVALLRDGAECFPAMLAAIARAEHEILLEMYWFDSDRTGTRFANALIERARSGVRVRVLYDAVGSFGVDATVFDRMRAAGVDVKEFNPLSGWRRHRSLAVLNRRDHRKILVVDASVAFTGGVNLSDHWAPPPDGDGWRDDMVLIEGPAALQLREVVVGLWRRLEGGAEDPPPCLPASSPTVSQVRALTNTSRGDRKAIRDEYLHQIRRASRSIYISNCYFIPDAVIRRELAAATARGVDVRVITAGNSDVALVRYASRSRYAWLMKRGVRIYEWTRTVFHAKTAVIDEHWCTVGTYNLDYRSWRFNLEVNLAIDDDDLGRSMRDTFLSDLHESRRIDPDAWRARPLFEMLMEWVSYAVRKLL